MVHPATDTTTQPDPDEGGLDDRDIETAPTMDGGPVEDAFTLTALSRKEQARRRKRERRLHHRPPVPIELELTGFASGGRAVARMPDGRVAFVRFGIPGERVIAEVDAQHPTYVEATAVLPLTPSPHRIEARCPYFGRCGGCQLQHIDYGEQLRLKTGVVRDQLRQLGRFEDAPVRDMIGLSHPWEYRNHMRFTVRRDGSVGFMEHGTHRFLRIEHCPIAHPAVNEVLHEVQGRTMQTNQISVRVGEQTGDLLVQPRLKWRPAKHGTTRSGQQWYTEQLAGMRYRISSAAFFQVNTRQAERLVELVVARVREAKPRRVVDAYAGVGTFAAIVAHYVPEVVTIEYSAAAGDDADINLGMLDNVQRIVGTVEAVLPALDPPADVVIVDPPRIGLERSVIDTLLSAPVRRIVYVSCDPGTLARDLRLLVDGGFLLTEVQPIDMFPQTQHIECITTLDRAR